MSKQQKTIRTVHKALKIPENYYQTPIYRRADPDLEPISQETRRKALHELCKAGIIDEPSLYPVLDRLVDRLDRMMDESDRKKALEKFRK